MIFFWKLTFRLFILLTQSLSTSSLLSFYVLTSWVALMADYLHQQLLCCLVMILREWKVPLLFQSQSHKGRLMVNWIFCGESRMLLRNVNLQGGGLLNTAADLGGGNLTAVLASAPTPSFSSSSSSFFSPCCSSPSSPLLLLPAVAPSRACRQPPL